MPAKTTPKTVPTWSELNDKLRSCDEKAAFSLLKCGRKEVWPPSLLQRVYQRYSTLRRDREIRELYAQEG